MIRFAGNEFRETKYITDNLYTECAYYPASKILVVINNSDQLQKNYDSYGIWTANPGIRSF
ncbi:1,3-beta-galactosyl-N-acetylhexosamine phosphorylase C-terminal domain-containing protein [Paenibacillus etheri]|uniref:1,3-beta-galactosyl-N-acetylhexosamine phosphorylase C-terminal domain-containing protein n=1 Tax=Paenibacillus etheri TaxID=1306852 RepID=UPI001FD77256|nr:1,3-beta-galactosyl-N-acetylhexosamine phosphorylase C-terminal domain-containing protein [Paenibacillus etheri]